MKMSTTKMSLVKKKSLTANIKLMQLICRRKLLNVKKKLRQKKLGKKR